MSTPAIQPNETGVALDRDKLNILLELTALAVRSGELPSVQVAVAHRGELIASETFGAASPNTRYVLQSAGRPVVAAAAWLLIARGQLDIGAPVASYVPEFDTNGKGEVTVEQVMTHVAGLPLAPLGHPAMCTRSERLAAFGRWRLTYRPGTRLEFHLTSAGWLLAELIEGISGRPLPQFIQDEICTPLGLRSLQLAVPLTDQHDVAATVRVGPDDGSGPSPWGPWYALRPEIIAAGEPSHTLVGTAADLAMFYQGVDRRAELWPTDLIADATRARVNLLIEGERGGAPSIPGGVGLFVQAAGTDGLSRGFLPTTGSARLWGGGGAPSQVGFLDPETGLSFAWLTNGYPVQGYESTRHGRNRVAHIVNLAADLVPAA